MAIDSFLFNLLSNRLCGGGCSFSDGGLHFKKGTFKRKKMAAFKTNKNKRKKKKPPSKQNKKATFKKKKREL